MSVLLRACTPAPCHCCTRQHLPPRQTCSVDFAMVSARGGRGAQAPYSQQTTGCFRTWRNCDTCSHSNPAPACVQYVNGSCSPSKEYTARCACRAASHCPTGHFSLRPCLRAQPSLRTFWCAPFSSLVSGRTLSALIVPSDRVSIGWCPKSCGRPRRASVACTPQISTRGLHCTKYKG